MIAKIFNNCFKSSRTFKNTSCALIVSLVLFYFPSLLSQDSTIFFSSNNTRFDSSQISYKNPRIYNLEISFEIIPDPKNIDKEKDLRVWIPIPREWDSQKKVQIISIHPEPYSQYIDPEFGNKIFYWDFGRYPEKPSYKVNIRARLLSYEIYTMIDSSKIKPYDKSSNVYELYTKPGFTIPITPKLKELAIEAIGNEKNPYLKAQKIMKFVHNKIRYSQNIRFNQGTNGSLDYMISNSKIDELNGEEYFLGDCSHYSALFVAICRSEGIPARCVYGRIGWRPFLNEQNSRMFSKLDTVITDEGFAGAQHHGLGPHMWAEFYLQDIGWIPVDPQAGLFGRLHNYKVIMTTGRDIDLGPNAPHKNHNGYGYQWVPINDGRVDGLLSAVYNIRKITNAKSNVYHTLDPFPADALMAYKCNLLSDDIKTLIKRRKGILSQIDYCSRDLPNRDIEFSKIYNDPIWIRSLQFDYDGFVCHMLHKIMGDEKFIQLLAEYERKLTNSPLPIQTDSFIQMVDSINGESLEWFFAQWEKSNGLPHLKIDDIKLSKDNNEWRITGKLNQSGSSFFVLPVEFSLETEQGQEIFTVWQRDKITNFEYQTTYKPILLKVDPNNDILKIQKMPIQLSRLWDSYPEITVIYGTVSESEANKAAAKRFNNDYLGLSSDIIKPDTSINDNELNTESVVLFGRPSANKVSERFANLFPIKFNKDGFSYNGINYSKNSQGLAQIIEHPFKSKGQFILYAGLSANGMLQFGDLYLYDSPYSFVIYDGDQQINSGNWEGDVDLLWKF